MHFISVNFGNNEEQKLTIPLKIVPKNDLKLKENLKLISLL